MSSPSIDLPSDLDSLRDLALRQHGEIAARDEKISAQDAEIRHLIECLRLLRHQRFGSKSEKHAAAGQLGLFNEAEATLDAEEKTRAKPVEIAAHTRTPRGRKPIPDHLPRIEIVHDLADEQKICPHDGTALVRIGAEACEQLEIIPATIRVLRHVRPKYACPACHDGVHAAKMPAQPIPKSMASPGLLACVATSKFVDALPLHRQEVIFARLGIDLPRATLAHWMVRLGDLVQPLINLLREDLLAGDLVQCDETRFQVLKEPGRRATSLSYLWAQRGGTRDAPIVLYDYDPSRGGDVPERLLEGFTGILQTDGHKGYATIGQWPGVVHAGCWAHARRKFDEAVKALPPKARQAEASRALEALRIIREIYTVERSIPKDAPHEERRRVRQEHSKPFVKELRRWLDAALPQVPPQTLTGKALGYLAHQWTKLMPAFDDGRIPLDTNALENSIRPFVVGRKNWLFADTVRGAHASANLYSLIETAKANAIEPAAYLRLVFTELPRATTLAEFEALLPRNVDRTQLGDPRKTQGWRDH